MRILNKIFSNEIKKETEKNDKNDSTIIEKRLVMPAIGNVSVGKSYFLNSLFGIDFCQVKSNITTKFILFIRHIDKLKEPRLYNIKPVDNYNSYTFIKNGETITGENNIKEKINNINSNLLVNEESMFYMLEIEIKSIKNKTFLNKVDFLDVPGLNESNTDYINLYFKYIKDMIKYCLIIFSTENYNSKDALEVINKVKNNIYVPMENFLLILNKIDKVNGKVEETMHDFKKVLLNNEGINFYNNTAIPVNSKQLKSEIQVETYFYHFINYYFIEYNNDKETKLLSFLEYIERKIKNIDSDKKRILKNEIKYFDEEQMTEIKNTFSIFINEMKSKGYILQIDFEDDNEMNTLKILYICFIKKLLVPKTSKTFEKINNYFDKIKDYSFPFIDEENEIQNEAFIENKFEDDDILLYSNVKEYVLLKNLDNFFTQYFNSPKLKKFGEIVNTLNEDFQVLKNYILNSTLIYIPVIGVSNSGKSSFINCLIQKDILTCNSSECTRRGMVIRYIKEKNKAYLYSIKFKSSKNLNQTYYYYTKNKLISDNIGDIKEIISITNESYPKNEEDCFFLLEINLKALDDLNIKPEIKNSICFIDFPGHNTNDNFFFDKSIYQKVLKMTSFFIYINAGKAFKEDANKLLLSKIFSEVISRRVGDISQKEYLDLCLFIFNKVDSLEEKERNFKDVKEDIKEILRLPNNFESNISCSFFSALIFKKFLEKKNEYETEFIINYLFMKFKSQEDEIDDDDDNLFGNRNKERDFTEFLKTNISKNIKFNFNQQNFKYNIENDISSSNIYKELKENVEKCYQERNIIKSENYEKNLITISKLLIFCQDNLTKLNYYKESYAKETFENIYIKINRSFNLKKREYDNHLGRFFYFMNKFFRLENVYENSENEKNEKKSKDFINDIEKLFKDFKGKEIVNKKIIQLSDYILNLEKNYYSLMRESGHDVEKVISVIDRAVLSEYTKINNLINEEIIILKLAIIDVMAKAGIDVKRIKIDLNYNEIKLVKGELRKKKEDNIFETIFLLTFPLFSLFKENSPSNEKIFGDYISKKLKEVEQNMYKYMEYINEKIEELSVLCISNANRLLGLRESNNIEVDDFWKNAKDVYIELFNQYIDIKN